MDLWKYFDITHKRHQFCNPLNTKKFERFCQLLQLKRGERVLDIACGKGEFIIRLAELYDIAGVGVDISPYYIQECEEKLRKRTPNSDIEFVQMDAANYTPKSPHCFDVVLCVGASWVYGGHRGTIQALKGMVKKGGLIVVGEPFWLKEPSKEYLEVEGIKKEDFGSHYDNVKVGENEGLTCLYTLVSNFDDWDHYETLQWWAVDEYFRAHPDDPDMREIVERKTREKKLYLQGGRETMGWAVYVFRNGGCFNK
ncbi:MAG: class I SAM-dependent methyltransferase [Crenarchaeota archaeon]|nr:class I SAM-dependent methyltransferase [Thermoproteota archaeon]